MVLPWVLHARMRAGGGPVMGRWRVLWHRGTWRHAEGVERDQVRQGIGEPGFAPTPPLCMGFFAMRVARQWHRAQRSPITGGAQDQAEWGFGQLEEGVQPTGSSWTGWHFKAPFQPKPFRAFMTHPCSLLAESVGDGRDRAPSSSPGEKLVAPASGEEAAEYSFLKETGSVKAFHADSSETPLLKSSDSERSSCGSGSASAALYAKVARLSKQSKEEEDTALSPERTKPRPPDPSTKPKVSWIHSRYSSSQSNSLPSRSPEPVAARPSSPEHGQGLAKRKRSPSETSAGVHGRAEEKGSGGTRGKERPQKHPKEPGVPEGKANLAAEPQSPSKPKQRSKASSEQMENINGAVQNAFKKMGGFHAERRAGEAPRSPGAGKPHSEALHPHLASEAATLLAAQLKEKTQSLNKAEGSARPNGVGAQREKPTPPQKAKRSAATGGQKASKPLLPTSPNLQKLIPATAEPAAGGEPRRVEKQTTASGQDPAPPGEQMAKKTPIKKPPRKKSREATLEPPKAAAVPTQTVQ